MKNSEIVKSKVCSHCGGKLRLKKITENSCFTNHKPITTEKVICEPCSIVEFGVDKEVFELARKLVQEYDFKYYTHLNPVDDGEEYCLKANTNGAVRLAKAILDGGITSLEQK